MEYQALCTVMNEIRLITILPRAHSEAVAAAGDVEQSNRIHCRLENVCLDDLYLFKDQLARRLPEGIWRENHTLPEVGPQRMQWRYTWGDYVALSYTWGDPAATCEIFINGRSVQVSKNLEACLRVLRETAPIQAGCKVWVDAVCIQQQNLGERNQQIKRMQAIYQKALDVVLWLGDEADGSSTAMDFMNALGGCWAVGSEDRLRDALRQELRTRGQAIWKAFNALMSRPYWERLWVIQEIAMGGESTPVFCGSRAVCWDDFRKTLYYFNSPAKDTIADCINEVMKEVGLSFWDLENNRVYWVWNRVHDLQIFQDVRANGHFPDINTVLRFGRHKSATEPRDKVYGLMGLFDSLLSSQIKPDYASPIPQVYTDFAEAHMNATGCLEILSECGGWGRVWANSDLPSWAPDWSDVAEEFRHLTASFEPDYKAGGNSASITYVSSGSGILSCQGIKVDTLDGLSSGFWSMNEDRDIEDNNRDIITQPIHRNNAYGSEEALENALWRTLVGNRDLSNLTSDPAPSGYRCLLDAFKHLPLTNHQQSDPRRYSLEFMQRNASFNIAGQRLDHYFPVVTKGGEAERQDQEAHVDEALTRFYRFALFRRLATTTKGYVAMVPHFGEQGDVVCVFLGCSIPILLRPVEDHYKIVSPMYMHGFMDGEAMELVAKGALQLDDITIR